MTVKALRRFFFLKQPVPTVSAKKKVKTLACFAFAMIKKSPYFF